jgi:hypothetical protein
MTYASSISAARRIFLAAICGALLGGFLGFASAQEGPSGQLDTACYGRCTANGYQAGFCGEVCLVPDPTLAAKGDGLDWKCMTGCRERGGRAEECMVSCQRR